MASYTIPKIGQKVKVNSLVWYRQYDSSLANIRNNDFGFIKAIEYNGNDIRFSSYQDSDVVYYVHFPVTPQAAPATIYCSYDDLIFNPCEELTPACAQTHYVSPFVDCCGRVHSPSSGEIVDPFERIFPTVHTKSGLPIRWIHGNEPESKYPRIEPKRKGYSPSLHIIDELATYDPIKEYIENDVKRQEQLYLYQYLQPYMKPVEVKTNVSVSTSQNIDKLHKFVKRLLNNEYGRHNAERNDPLIKTVKTSEKEKSIVSTIDFRVKKIMHNGPATIVFWKDGTKTVVRLKEGDKYDQYAAFTAAVAKRLYGKTVKISEIVDRYSKDLKKIDIPEAPPRELSVEELKAAADKLGYRVSKKPKK